MRLFARHPIQQEQLLIIKHLQACLKKVTKSGGRQLFADHSASHDLSVTLPAHGLFIVKVGQHTVKVAK